MSLDSKLKTILNKTLTEQDANKSLTQKGDALLSSADSLRCYCLGLTGPDVDSMEDVDRLHYLGLIGQHLVVLASIADDLGLSLSDCLTEWSQNYRRLK